MCCKTFDVKFWKGQSIIKTEEDIQKAWDYAMEGSRGDLMEALLRNS